MPLTMSAITLGSAHTSWVRCPSADDFGCGFHGPFSLGTRSMRRRLDLNSSSISFRNDWPIVTVVLRLGSEGCSQRQREGEHGSDARLARCGEIAAHPARQLAADRHAEPGAFVLASKRVVKLDVGLEDHLQLFG